MDVTICDVGPRDGLQNEAAVLGPAVRAELIERIAATGVPRIEAVSFVNPKLVPAMAGAEDVMALLKRRPGAIYSGLAMNERGYDRAIVAGVDEVRFGLAATDEFGIRNQNRTADQGLEAAQTLIRRARADEKRISVAISVAFGCPFAGWVDPAKVINIVERLADDPPDELSLADTIGVAVPTQVRELVREVKSDKWVTGVHFHNTRNTGLANAVAGLEAGATVVDASVGGSGGCPFAPRATGNIASEDLVYLLHGMGVDTGIDLDALIDVSLWLAEQLGKELPSALARAGTFAPVANLYKTSKLDQSRSGSSPFR